MTPRIWYILLVLALATAAWALPSEAGYVAITAWAVACGAAYAIAAVRLAAASVGALAIWAFLVTAVLPVAILVAIAWPSSSVPGESIVEVMRQSSALLPLAGAEFMLPTIAAVIAALSMRTFLNPTSCTKGSKV